MKSPICDSVVKDLTRLNYFLTLQKATKVCIQVDGKVVRMFEPEDLKKVKEGFGFKRLWESGELACGASMVKVAIIQNHVTCR